MNMILKKACACMLVAVCFLLVSGCGKNKIQARESVNGTLIVGSDIYSPYFYLGDDGNFTGIDVEIAKEACRRLGVSAEFKKIEWQSKDEYLADKTVDCLWGSFSMNGREELYAWAGPYMYSRQVVAVLGSSDIYKLTDLNDKCISVQNATKPDGLFSQDQVSGVSVKKVYSFGSMPLAFAALKKGYVDACAGHETALRDYMKNVNGDYRILDEYLLKANLGVAFERETGKKQAERLTFVLEDMKEDGTIRSIIENYDLDIDFALKGDIE